MSAREIGAQPFAGLELMSFNQRAAIAAPPSCKPSQRTFGFVANNFGTAKLCDKLALH
ncbi:MAG TPA: hypothetical protein VKD19_00950 [Pseudolabrys sp.]|nr:hypothetical protein [Pseudolabrys sp.]